MTILLVVDYDDARYLLKVMLEMLEHEVIEATSGLEAVEYLKKKQPDLILLDMTGSEGVTVTKMIQELEAASDIPIISLPADNKKSWE